MATHKPVLPRVEDSEGIESFIGQPVLKNVDVGTRSVTYQIRSSTGTGPDFSVPISSILPGSEYDTFEFWKALVDSLMQLLREQKRYPAFVKGYAVAIDEDSSGEPSLYIKILVARRENYSTSTLNQWNQFVNLLQHHLFGLRLQRYPYVQIGEKRGSR